MKQTKDSVVPITSVQIQTPLIVTPQIKQQTKIAIKKDKKTAKKEFDEIISLFKQRESSNKPVHVVLIELSELIRVDPDLIDDLLTVQFKKYIVLKHQSSDDRFFIAYMNLIRTIITSYHDAFDQKKNSEQPKINKTDKKDKSSKTRDQEGRSKIIIKIRIDHLRRIQQNNSLLLSSNKYVILSLLLLLQTIMKHEKQKNFKGSIDVNTISKIIQRINSFGPILKPYPSLDEYFDISAPSISQHVQTQSLVELALDVVFEYVLGSAYKSHMTNRVGIEIQSSIPQFVILHNRCSIGDEDEIQNNNIDDEEDEEEEDSDEIITKGKNQGKKKKKSVKEKKKTKKEKNKTKSKGRTNKKGSEDDADEQQEFFIEDEDVANLAKSIRNKKEDQKLNENEIETRKQLQMRLRVIRAKCALTHGLLADKMKDMKETLKMKDALFGVIGSDGNELGKSFGLIPRPRDFSNYQYEQKREIFKRYFTKNKYEKINKEINYGLKLAFWGDITSPRIILALDCLSFFYEQNFSIKKPLCQMNIINLVKKLILIQNERKEMIKDDEEEQEEEDGRMQKDKEDDDEYVITKNNKSKTQSNRTQINEKGKKKKKEEPKSIKSTKIQTTFQQKKNIAPSNMTPSIFEIQCIASNVIFSAMKENAQSIQLMNKDQFLFKLFNLCRYDSNEGIIRFNDYFKQQENNTKDTALNNQYRYLQQNLNQQPTPQGQKVKLHQTFIKVNNKINLVIITVPTKEQDDDIDINTNDNRINPNISNYYHRAAYWYASFISSKEFDMFQQDLIKFLKRFVIHDFSTKQFEDLLFDSGLFEVLGTFMNTKNTDKIQSIFDTIFAFLKKIHPKSYPLVSIQREESTGIVKLNSSQIQPGQTVTVKSLISQDPVPIHVTSVPIHQLDQQQQTQSSSLPLIDYGDVYGTLNTKSNKDEKDGTNSFTIAHLIAQQEKYEERHSKESESNREDIEDQIQVSLQYDQKPKFNFRYYNMLQNRSGKTVQETLQEGIKDEISSNYQEEQQYENWLLRKYKIGIENVIHRRLLVEWGLIDLISNHTSDPIYGYGYMGFQATKQLCHILLSREIRSYQEIQQQYRNNMAFINGIYQQQPIVQPALNYAGIDNDELDLAMNDVTNALHDVYRDDPYDFGRLDDEVENDEDEGLIGNEDEFNLLGKQKRKSEEDDESNDDDEKEINLFGKNKIISGELNEKISQDGASQKRRRKSEDTNSDSEE
ncbi:MAG: hypothetical protein EZS28_019651 [Streblomastix strix]|uniref:Uncharacterized protein n=1 Tax=Streblomastix strix TaxID=222440 RepID=A0A5J4VR89_9EUKA|nr:MAG: hypothetical protein EZS28_019651 [Streblomastix strix]